MLQVGQSEILSLGLFHWVIFQWTLSHMYHKYCMMFCLPCPYWGKIKLQDQDVFTSRQSCSFWVPSMSGYLIILVTGALAYFIFFIQVIQHGSFLIFIFKLLPKSAWFLPKHSMDFCLWSLFSIQWTQRVWS